MPCAFLPPAPRAPRRRRAPRGHPSRPRICAAATTPAPVIAAAAAAAAAVVLSSTAPTSALPPPPPPPTIAAQPPSAALPRIQDNARVLTTGQSAALSKRLSALEASTTLRLLVFTRAPSAPQNGTNIRWKSPPANTVVIAVDPAAGNALSFSVGPGVYARLPASFWLEASNRFGNAFYVRDRGLDAALLDVVTAVEACADPGRLCKVVPGVSDDQWKVSLVSAAVGGSIAGAAARTGGKKLNWPFLALFSPLWSIFLVSFGLGPVVSRGPGVELQLSTTIASFVVLAAAVWWWIPVRFGEPGRDDESVM